MEVLCNFDRNEGTCNFFESFAWLVMFTFSSQPTAEQCLQLRWNTFCRLTTWQGCSDPKIDPYTNIKSSFRRAKKMYFLGIRCFLSPELNDPPWALRAPGAMKTLMVLIVICDIGLLRQDTLQLSKLFEWRLEASRHAVIIWHKERRNWSIWYPFGQKSGF